MESIVGAADQLSHVGSVIPVTDLPSLMLRFVGRRLLTIAEVSQFTGMEAQWKSR